MTQKKLYGISKRLLYFLGYASLLAVMTGAAPSKTQGTALIDLDSLEQLNTTKPPAGTEPFNDLKVDPLT